MTEYMYLLWYLSEIQRASTQIKSSFFDENEHHLAINRNYAEIYAAQPIRNLCKNCDSEIGGSDVVDFTSHSIPYRFCKTCGHLNGLYQDTNEFCESIYMDDESDYADAYLEKDIIKFNERPSYLFFHIFFLFKFKDVLWSNESKKSISFVRRQIDRLDFYLTKLLL